MRALTLTQPWASFACWGLKGPETRSWRVPRYILGQRIAIHASKGFPGWAKALCRQEPFCTVITENLRRNEAGQFCFDEVLKNFPLGAVVCTAIVTGCVRTEDVGVLGQSYESVKTLWVTPQQWAFGDYSPGRFAWILEDIKPLSEPVPAKGMLSLWEWEGAH